MGTKFKEVNTLSLIGNIRPKTERVWKEVDEELVFQASSFRFRVLGSDIEHGTMNCFL